MQLETAYVNRNDLQSEPPDWYIRKPGKVYAGSDLKWFYFKDVDGEEAAALLDVETDRVITVVKRGVV